MQRDEEFQVDLTNCDREPIHQLGRIQPFGFLLALSTDWLIRRASANVDQMFGKSALDLLGTDASALLGQETTHNIRNRLTMLRGADAVERIFGLPITTAEGERRFDFALHMNDDLIFIEGEASAAKPSSDAASTIRGMISRLDTVESLPDLYREGARQVRALTGFDRVMVYRFDQDGAGTVAAESARPGIGKFLGLRYPASDIPQQARQLYIRTPFRIIADVDAEPVPIIPERDENGHPIDLSLSILRSVSPIHIEYLKNMGVGASLSISIIVDGKLWGLFACHHYEPRCPDFERRTIAELFGQLFALKLESRERTARAEYETRARGVGDRILAAIAGNATLIGNPEWLGHAMREVVPSDGIAIWVDGQAAVSGSAPPIEAIPDIARRLNAMAAGRIHATDHLSGLIARADDFSGDAAGMLAIPISRTPRDYVMLFREEKIRTVNWAGDPHKPASYGPNGARLSPRKSFEAWSQEVRGRSEPFTTVELRVADMLRASLIEVVLRMTDDAQEERQRATERQELLIAELNHRVRNILGLIRGLVRQSRDSGQDLDSYIEMLGGRIESLARAHDQITRDSWSPAPLKSLIETEASAYFGEKASRVEVKGPPVLLKPQAYSTLALVLHELMTNSAKYGALSDNGTVNVQWSLDDAGDLNIFWREQGGPAVQPPSRAGFGSTIIRRSIPYDLGGKAEVRYPLLGLEAEFCVPARHVEQGGPETLVDLPVVNTGPKVDPIDHPCPLSGNILLVEDSLIIAMDAEDMLENLGAEHVITASSSHIALSEIERNDLVAAILDINLGGETSLSIADKLAEKNIPFLFATGYGEQVDLPERHREAMILKKPYSLETLASAFETLLGQ